MADKILIEPIGRPRDIQIDVLKGRHKKCADRHKWDSEIFYWTKKGCVKITCVKCGADYFERKEQCWSTNHNDAWQLFNEMPIIEKIRLLTAILSYYWTLREFEKEGTKKTEPDWADFITVAWITWKGSQ